GQRVLRPGRCAEPGRGGAGDRPLRRDRAGMTDDRTVPARDRARSDDEERMAMTDQRTAPADEQAASTLERGAADRAGGDGPDPAAVDGATAGPPSSAVLDGAAAADRAEAAADRANGMLVLIVLLIDAALLAMLELMFLTASVGRVPLPLSALVALVS